MRHWTDSHNHLQDSRLGDHGPVIAAMKSSGVTCCVVNATSQADWAAVENLSRAEPEWARPAFGIHPWRAHTAAPGWESELCRLLESHPHATLGECGLDTWIAEPQLDVQLAVFLAQLRIARELSRPITIHCLKAWGPLFDAFAKAPPPSQFLMHSFGGSIEIARRLIPLGAYFSFSGHFLNPRKSAVREVFRQLPRDRILLETDAPDMLPPPEAMTHPLSGSYNHPANLSAIGQGFAATLGMPVETLAELTRNNACRCFGF